MKTHPTLAILKLLLLTHASYSFSLQPSILHNENAGRRHLSSKQNHPHLKTGTRSNERNRCSSELCMIGDFVSGITGQAPKSLDVPFEKLLAGTNIDPSRDNVDLQCVYKGSRDGWSAIDFHSNCDGRGSALVVVLSQSGKKFGGFNPLGWQSSDDYGNTNAAFLWFPKGSNDVVKCPVLAGGNAAIFDFATGGPQFGSGDLVIGKPQAAVMVSYFCYSEVS